MTAHWFNASEESKLRWMHRTSRKGWRESCADIFAFAGNLICDSHDNDLDEYIYIYVWYGSQSPEVLFSIQFLNFQRQYKQRTLVYFQALDIFFQS